MRFRSISIAEAYFCLSIISDFKDGGTAVVSFVFPHFAGLLILVQLLEKGLYS